jgi:dephospho-CoA kinase
MMKVGITGGIGSGKSYICKILNKRGINIYDCDDAAKRIIRISSIIHKKLIALIGNDIFINGMLNKEKMTEFLLASETNTFHINEIVHPEVARDFISSGYQWIECAILFESGFDRLVDKKILISAPIEIRIERIMARNKITRSKAMEWIQRQWAEDDIRKLCDYEIINDGKSELNHQIDIVLNKLK